MKAPGKYLSNRESALQIIIEKPRAKFTPGSFHQLRVEIKKLDAFFDLIKYCSKDFKRKKTFKPFKQIFRQAGKVRELQLEEVMLKKYGVNNSLKDYLAGLRNRRLKEREIYFTIMNKEMADRLKKSFQEIRPFLASVKNKKVNRYLEKKTNSIKKLIGEGILLPEQLHQLRIKLKMLNYNRKSLSLEPQLPKKDVLPVLLGKWHDLQVMNQHLQKTIDTGELQSKEIIQLEKINAKISSESEILFTRINKALPESEFFEASK